MKKIHKLIITTPIVLLASCTSNPKITQIGNGVVQSEQLLSSKKEIKKEEIKQDVFKGTGTGAAVGAGTGAVAGATTGAVVGGVVVFSAGTAICTAFTLGLGFAPCAASFGGVALAGAGAGALVGGGAGALIGAGGGALVGAGSGYVYASNKDLDKIKGKYRYEVLEDGKSTPITFEQFPDRDYRVGDKVEVYESEYKGNKTYFIAESKHS